MHMVVIAHNLRSAHNVGSLLRTADGMGIDEVILSGYTPFPPLEHADPRLPHERDKALKLIHKTALGAEISQHWSHQADVTQVINRLREAGFTIAALEQSQSSLSLPDYKAPDMLALVLGREVEGVEPEVLDLCDLSLEIPMVGKKESFNVIQAAAMAMYHCRYLA